MGTDTGTALAAADSHGCQEFCSSATRHRSHLLRAAGRRGWARARAAYRPDLTVVSQDRPHLQEWRRSLVAHRAAMAPSWGPFVSHLPLLYSPLLSPVYLLLSPPLDRVHRLAVRCRCRGSSVRTSQEAASPKRPPGRWNKQGARTGAVGCGGEAVHERVVIIAHPSPIALETAQQQDRSAFFLISLLPYLLLADVPGTARENLAGGRRDQDLWHAAASSGGHRPALRQRKRAQSRAGAICCSFVAQEYA